LGYNFIHDVHVFVVDCVFITPQSLNGSRFSTGVVPRDVRLRIVELNVGSAELLRGVCIPDGVELPLIFLLVGAGLAEPDAVFRVIVVPVAPFVRVVVVVVVTERRAGRGVAPPLAECVLVVAEGLRCGMREGVVSSVLSNERFEP